jgi:hypothetical protein
VKHRRKPRTTFGASGSCNSTGACAQTLQSLKEVVALAAVVEPGLKTTALETGAQIHRDTGRCDQASLNLPLHPVAPKTATTSLDRHRSSFAARITEDAKVVRPRLSRGAIRVLSADSMMLTTSSPTRSASREPFQHVPGSSDSRVALRLEGLPSHDACQRVEAPSSRSRVASVRRHRTTGIGKRRSRRARFPRSDLLLRISSAHANSPDRDAPSRSA